MDSIVEHPRDARIELLAKFVLRDRANLSNVGLARRQRKLFAEFAQDFKTKEQNAAPNSKLVSRWRFENIQAMIRLLDSVISA
jgi:hypothetical protein